MTDTKAENVQMVPKRRVTRKELERYLAEVAESDPPEVVIKKMLLAMHTPTGATP